MNKKGFTLVELLAVIVILGIVSGIGVISVTAVRKNINKNLLKEKIDMIISSAMTYGEDMGIKNKTVGDIISLSELIDEKYYDTDEECNGVKCVKNDVTGESLNDLQIKIYKENKRVYACVNDSNLIKDYDGNKKCS